MNPENNSVEICESIYGVPIILHQGHPEAYDPNINDIQNQANRNLILFMAKAGDAFYAKQRLLDEFKKTRSGNHLNSRVCEV